MGNWHIAIDGHGVHDNGLDHDAEQRLKQFVEQLLNDGHQINNVSLTVGSARALVIRATEGTTTHYVHLP